MRFAISFLLFVFLFTSSYAILLNNRAGVDMSSADLYEMARVVGEDYSFEVTKLDVYYEKTVLVHEFSGYKTIKEGYATVEKPYSIRLNENLDPLIQSVTREDNIGYRSIFLGIPGVLSYLFYKVIGVL